MPLRVSLRGAVLGVLPPGFGSRFRGSLRGLRGSFGSDRGSRRGSLSGKGSFGEGWRPTGTCCLPKITFGLGMGSDPRGIFGTELESSPGNVVGVPPLVGTRRMLQIGRAH